MLRLWNLIHSALGGHGQSPQIFCTLDPEPGFQQALPLSLSTHSGAGLQIQGCQKTQLTGLGLTAGLHMWPQIPNSLSVGKFVHYFALRPLLHFLPKREAGNTTGLVLRVLVLNGWEVTPVGIKRPFCRGRISDIYVTVHNSGNVTVVSRDENHFMVGGHHNEELY